MPCRCLLALAGTTLLTIIGGCKSLGEPGAGDTWRASEVRVAVALDTVAPTDGTPVEVTYNTTLRTPDGYPQLWATVRATNLTDRPLMGETGFWCHWMFTAFDNPELAGEPLWNGEEIACRTMALRLELGAGATQVFPAKSLDFDAITASRGPGTYYFAARLRGRLGDQSTHTWGEWGWLTERVPAGSVVLLP